MPSSNWVPSSSVYLWASVTWYHYNIISSRSEILVDPTMSSRNLKFSECVVLLALLSIPPSLSASQNYPEAPWNNNQFNFWSDSPSEETNAEYLGVDDHEDDGDWGGINYDHLLSPPPTLDLRNVFNLQEHDVFDDEDRQMLQEMYNGVKDQASKPMDSKYDDRPNRDMSLLSRYKKASSVNNKKMKKQTTRETTAKAPYSAAHQIAKDLNHLILQKRTNIRDDTRFYENEIDDKIHKCWKRMKELSPDLYGRMTFAEFMKYDWSGWSATKHGSVFISTGDDIKSQPTPVKNKGAKRTTFAQIMHIPPGPVEISHPNYFGNRATPAGQGTTEGANQAGYGATGFGGAGNYWYR
eukprot:770746_1